MRLLEEGEMSFFMPKGKKYIMRGDILFPYKRKEFRCVIYNDFYLGEVPIIH
jgi:hypothetical protein